MTHLDSNLIDEYDVSYSHCLFLDKKKIYTVGVVI